VTLEATGVTGGYGDIVVLRELSVAASAGTITAVLGRNGAGKTSLLSAIAGLLPTVSEGIMTLDGVDLRHMTAYDRTGAGLGFVQEGKRIFQRRTVEENLVIGGHTLRHPLLGLRRGPQVKAGLEKAYERFPMLASRRTMPAGKMSGGQQQMLAIAQALMASPKALMLDEPSAGLAPSIVADVFALVAELKRDGLAVLLVEQVIEQALAIADEVVVLEGGRVVAKGPVSAFDDAAVVRDLYLGRHEKMEKAPPAP
jgi:branched-chain amino acid transport system ATP-binding protein